MNYRRALAGMLLESGDLDDAIQCLTKILEVKADNAHVHALLAIVFEKKGDAATAAAWYKKAVAMSRSEADVCRAMSTILGKIAPEQAIDWQRKATRIQPNDVQNHIRLGRLLQENGQATEAIHCYRTANQRNSRSAHLELGKALVESKDLDGALASFCEGLRLNQNNPELMRVFPETLQAKGHFAEAYFAYQRLLGQKVVAGILSSRNQSNDYRLKAAECALRVAAGKDPALRIDPQEWPYCMTTPTNGCTECSSMCAGNLRPPSRVIASKQKLPLRTGQARSAMPVFEKLIGCAPCRNRSAAAGSSSGHVQTLQKQANQQWLE